MYFQIFYSVTLLAVVLLVIAHPLHPRTAVLQTRDLIGAILAGGGVEPVTIAAPVTPDINNPQTTTIGGGFTVPTTSTIPSASRLFTTVSSISPQSQTSTSTSQATPFITSLTTTGHPSETSSATTSIAIGYVADAPVTPPGEATEWKVIGIAVIAITFITIVVLGVTFFDSWWGFLRAMFFGDKHNGGDEKLVPDWNKRSWEYKLANEDGHRYPTMTSLESIVKVPEKSVQGATSPATTRLSQHDYSPSALRLVREVSLRKAGMKS